MSLRNVLVVVLGGAAVLVVADKLRQGGVTGAAGTVDTLASDAAAGSLEHAPSGTDVDTRARLAQVALIRSSAGQTYLDSLFPGTDSLIRRWPDRGSRPFTVAMVGGGSPDYLPRHQALVRDAGASWDQEGLGFRFRFQADTTGADVVVRWRTSFTATERAGQTDLLWDQLGHIRSAVITLAIRAKLVIDWVPIPTIYEDAGSHIHPIAHVTNFLRVARSARRSVGTPLDLGRD